MHAAHKPAAGAWRPWGRHGTVGVDARTEGAPHPLHSAGNNQPPSGQSTRLHGTHRMQCAQARPKPAARFVAFTHTVQCFCRPSPKPTNKQRCLRARLALRTLAHTPRRHNQSRARTPRTPNPQPHTQVGAGSWVSAHCRKAGTVATLQSGKAIMEVGEKGGGSHCNDEGLRVLGFAPAAPPRPPKKRTSQVRHVQVSWILAIAADGTADARQATRGHVPGMCTCATGASHL